MDFFRKIVFLAAFLFLFIPLVAASGATAASDATRVPNRSALPAGVGDASTFHATLSGKNQSPPIDTAAHGTATFVLSKTGKSLSFRLYVANVENVSMAHIHIGPAGKEGPVVVWLYPSHPPAQVKKGKFSGELGSGVITATRLQGPLKGKTIDDLVQEIKNGDAYVNVHTVQHPAGEIRGQIE